jgi:hypothetical protein
VTDLLDRLPALWNTSSRNPAVRARQDRSASLTAQQCEHVPGYAAELARLQAWLTDYDTPITLEDAA